jgi:hypothetical protein
MNYQLRAEFPAKYHEVIARFLYSASELICQRIGDKNPKLFTKWDAATSLLHSLLAPLGSRLASHSLIALSWITQ